MNPNSISNQHIFIVEDNTVMQYILKRIFRHVCTLTLFNNGQECLSALQDGAIPDLIITDLNTPNLNGMQLIRIIKTNAELCDIPVVAMSADNSTDTKLKCLAAGAVNYQTKPFQPEDLLQSIKQIMQDAHKKVLLMHA